jgi:hypothetical protein
MLKNIKKFAKKFFLQTPGTLFTGKNTNKLDYFSQTINFDKNNSKEIFYIIRRNPGTGFFSNITFVLNHLLIAKKFEFIPIVDMENYKTIYNEIRKIKKTFNAWEYFFKPLTNYKLSEIYKNKKYIITDNKFYDFFCYNMDKNIEILNQLKRIELKPEISKIINRFKIPKNTLGVHFRGTSYKRSPGHPFPATTKQMSTLIDKLLLENKYDKIFLSTEEEQYLNYFKKKYSNKLIYLKNVYRSNKNDAFKVYPRLNHRYKLGREILIETLLLSRCDCFVYVCSNVSSAAIAFNKNPNQIRIEIQNGLNSKNQIISQFLWYIKKILPKFLGGFGNDIQYKIYK